MTTSSKEAKAYLIDPLTAPEPSAETGPGSHFVSPDSKTPAPITRDITGSSTGSNNPYRQSQHRHTNSTASHHSHRSTHSVHSSHGRHASTGSQPEKFPNYRAQAFGDANDVPPPGYDAAVGSSSGRRRTSSLKERFPGDDSHKPLDIIRRDSKKASRSPHLQKRHMHGTDTIDRLDPTTKFPYHHEGPYDAASMARNSVPKGKPIDALRDSNAEALKATPPENIKDSLEHRVPLSGTAVVPPGVQDRLGRVLNYEEGANQMIEGNPDGGQYKRWEGVDYHPDDFKGKGEPSYSRDLADAQKASERRTHESERGIELHDRPNGHGSGHHHNGVVEGLKKRVGSLKKKKNRDD